MRILLTGVNGQVGWELQRTLSGLGKVVGVDRARLDLSNPHSICQLIREIKPDVIINPAAYTAVDRAESEPGLAQAINGVAPGVLAEESKDLGALLIHYSTDYVFDGEKAAPYIESDPTSPLNVYGQTKLAGESAITQTGCHHLIFRTSWVYGLRGSNFLRTMLRLATERDELRIVADQIGAPTWSRMIAETTALALARYQGQQGVYHLVAAGETSWYGFAQEIFTQALENSLIKKSPALHRIASADFSSPARRPANSRLNCQRLATDFGLSPPHWQDQLALCLSS
jgi:dTDP-4-dehydrorhamnose reductase